MMINMDMNINYEDDRENEDVEKMVAWLAQDRESHYSGSRL